MPYEYRKLSPQEQQAIVIDRRKQGYPLHAPPHPFRQTGAYLITAVNFEHRAVMNSPYRRNEFEAKLLRSMNRITEEPIAWAILPNHDHVLISIESLNDVSIALKHLHGTTSREWNIEDNLTGRRRVWYKFTDTYIRSETHLHTAFNYIHYNPVKHGYVTDPYNWPWSSLHMYYEEKGKAWLQEQWNTYQPSLDFGNGWGDDVRND